MSIALGIHQNNDNCKIMQIKLFLLDKVDDDDDVNDDGD